MFLDLFRNYLTSWTNNSLLCFLVLSITKLRQFILTEDVGQIDNFSCLCQKTQILCPGHAMDSGHRGHVDSELHHSRLSAGGGTVEEGTRTVPSCHRGNVDEYLRGNVVFTQTIAENSQLCGSRETEGRDAPAEESLRPDRREGHRGQRDGPVAEPRHQGRGEAQVGHGQPQLLQDGRAGVQRPGQPGEGVQEGGRLAFKVRMIVV